MDKARVKRQWHWRRVLLGLLPVVLALLHALGMAPQPWLDRLDNLIHDARLQAGMSRTPHADVVIVDIDEQSLAEIGRWPWPRDRVAQLVEQLFEQEQIRVLAFDMVFAESDQTSPAGSLQRLSERLTERDPELALRVQGLASDVDHDQRLASALQERPVVLGYYFTSDRNGHAHGQLPRPVLSVEAGVAGLRTTRWNGFGSNLPLLAQAAPRAGFFNAITDPDGVVRSLPLLAEFQGDYYESLALAVYREVIGAPVVLPQWSDVTTAAGADRLLSGLRVQGDAAGLTLGVDSRAAAWVPFRGPGGPQGGSFRYLSAADVMKGRVAPGFLRDKIVLLGTTAPGLLDLRNTPVGQAYPGVEVHANLIAGMLEGRLLQRPDYAEGYELGMLLLVGLSLAVLLPLVNATTALLVGLSTATGLLVLNLWLFQQHALVLPLASALVLVLALLAINMSDGYLAESRSRRRLARLFGHYVPRELVHEMYRDPDHYNMQAQSRELTVMFCDMRGFTTLSETLSPAVLQQLLNRVFSRLTLRIQAQRGTIDKYMGDCVMAFWGAPLPSERHAGEAVQAALDMSAEIVGINREQVLQNLPTIGVGIGLSTGDMMVGDMGSDIRRSYTVIGDAVNLGSRLEGLSRVYGVDIVASDATRRAAPDFLWMELDRVRVKGREQPETIHTPLCPLDQSTAQQRDQVQVWHTFLQAWRQQQWGQCEAMLKAAATHTTPSTLHQLFHQRLGVLRTQTLPSDWDGVTDFDSK